MTPAATTSTKKRRSREETRQKLLDSALQVFARNGYERATVDEIVREAGFSKGAFYVHFETKEDLFWEMLQERIDAQQEQFRQTLDASQGVAENERRILEQAFNMNTHPLGPAVILEFMAHGMRNEKVREQLANMYARWHSFVSETLTVGQRTGRRPPGPGCFAPGLRDHGPLRGKHDPVAPGAVRASPGRPGPGVLSRYR